MKDKFTEDVIKKEKNTGNTVLIVCFGILAGIAFFLNVFRILLFGYFLCLVFGFLAYAQSLKHRVEYEFVMTNESVEVAAIYNLESRKPLIAFELTEVRMVAPSDSPRLEHERVSGQKKYKFLTGVSGHKRYSIMCEVKGLKSEIVLEPTDRILEHIRMYCQNVFYED